MNIPTKKLTNGFEIPVFGLGTWQMGGKRERDPQNDDEKDIRAIREAIKLGVKHIDTAESYADGYSETLVGKAIENINRQTLFLVSKVKQDNLSYNDVLKSCEATLKRLRTNYLDLYLIHSPSFEIPIDQTLGAMDKLVDDGLVKYIGVSNFSTERLKASQKLTKNKIVVNQVYYNLMMREPENDGLLEYCKTNDIILEAYRPLEKGLIINPIEPILEKLAKKYKKTPAQVAINWLISQKNVITISKTSTVDHLKENIGSVDWLMESADIEYLKLSYPNQQIKSESLPLR